MADRAAETAVEVSIVIPTMRRQTFLPALVERLLGQGSCEEIGVELVIVDNSPERSARAVVTELQGKHGARLRYLSEPRPGVSHVRNTGVAAARGRLIAFIDDDEIPSEHWLASLLACRSGHHADVVLGPVYPVFEQPEVERDPFFRNAFTQSSARPTGAIVEPNSPLRALLRRASCYRIMATNNALVDARLCREHDPAFDPALTHLGGEDVLFFHNLYLSGKKIVWCREAIVYERIPAERSELRYLLQRRFRNGQITSATCLLSNPHQYARLLTSVALGLAQFLAGAGQFIFYVVAGNRRARDALALAAAGAGKIAWMRRFQRRSYGLGAAEAGR
jgi:succinoglycan biosynthesis protein ExoM